MRRLRRHLAFGYVDHAPVVPWIARLAEGAGKSAEALKAQMEKEGDLVNVRGRIREEKTLDLLKASASIELT